jgi:hypothetical protein
MLNEAGLAKEVKFVGTLPGQGCGFDYDGANEGHGGFQATNIAKANQLVDWLQRTKPDVVMMHLGTNDAVCENPVPSCSAQSTDDRHQWNGKSAKDIIDAFSKLLDQMRDSKSTMKLLVSLYTL